MRCGEIARGHHPYKACQDRLGGTEAPPASESI